MSTLISGGRIVTAGGQKDADVLLEHRTISLIGDLAGIPADETVDASGCYVIPGAVDVHTHLDMDVGVTVSADDFTTGTRAAACGGTTTVVDFATAYRGESIAEGLANWHAKADGKALIDYAFHMSVTELTRPTDDIVAEMGESGITSFKLYMTYPDRLMVSDDVIRQMMIAAEKQNALICLHCEDDTSVTRLRNEALASGHREPRWHAWSRPPDAEASAVERAVRMVEDTGAAVYIVHLSSAPALEHVRLARERGLPVFAETCPQYLYLSADRYEAAPEVAARYVCAPPLRDVQHHEELWAGLEGGYLQVVSTDHCPFEQASKNAGLAGGGWNDFTQIPGGLPGVEARLALVYQRVVDGEMTLERWVDLCCTTPARIFGLYPAKGCLEEGADADLVIFDPNEERPLVPERLHSNLDYSVYEHIVVRGWPRLVYSRGEVVAKDGAPVGDPGRGNFVERGPSGRPTGTGDTT
ncbi:MAG: dihydropyrimidinase [Actinobacteria bacterium]|nr:dihydropyrimidinase [Actinomycetota bacterium]